MDPVSMWILIIVLMIACIFLAVALALVTKKYVDLATEVKGISKEAAYKECGMLSKYAVEFEEYEPKEDDTSSTEVECLHETNEYDAIEDEKDYRYDIRLEHRNNGTGIARIVTESGFKHDIVLDVYEDGNDVLFVILDDEYPVFEEVEFLISRYLDLCLCTKDYKNVYFFSDYDFHMYIRSCPGHYDQILYNTFEIDSLEKSEYLEDGYCLCRIHIMRECELVEGAIVHSYFQNVTKVLHAGEMEE